ncbi:protein kinase [Mitsuokella sp.]|uniref:protein kinase n=1 Tax=unclassified Mitsuokella TaxID=2637239 RepID=UPI003D7CB988
MARATNYDAKIATLEEKIAKKKTELKKLKAELAAVKENKAKADYKELLEYMSEHDIAANDVLGMIKE